jgi:hypothetical protein
MLYWGMLSYRNVFCLLSFEVWLSAGKPPSLVRVRSIRVLAVFYRFDPHAPFLGKRKEGGERRTTLIGRVLMVSGKLLTGNSSVSPCSIL